MPCLTTGHGQQFPRIENNYPGEELNLWAGWVPPPWNGDIDKFCICRGRYPEWYMRTGLVTRGGYDGCRQVSEMSHGGLPALWLQETLPESVKEDDQESKIRSLMKMS